MSETLQGQKRDKFSVQPISSLYSQVGGAQLGSEVNRIAFALTYMYTDLSESELPRPLILYRTEKTGSGVETIARKAVRLGAKKGNGVKL